MNRLIPGIVLLVGALAISGPAAAHGGYGGHGHGGWYGPGPLLGAAVVGAVVGATVYGGHDRTVYVERQPVYYAPPPVYVQPPPQPLYYQPYYAPPRRHRATAPIMGRRRCITGHRAGKG